MRKVIVNEFMSLDGVVQAPGGADEDTSGGFEHEHNPVDELRLMIDPVVLGGGKRIFRDDASAQAAAARRRRGDEHRGYPRDVRSGRSLTTGSPNGSSRRPS